MNLLFSLRAQECPDYESVLFGLNLADVEPIGLDEIPDGDWPDGLIHFHRPGLSTRGVEVEWDDGEFLIQISPLSSWEDFDLGLRFVESAAAILGGEIQVESGDSFPVEELRDRYTSGWLRQANESTISSIRALLEEDQVLMMVGATRPFHIGAALMDEIDESGPPETFQDRLIDIIRQVQNVDPDSFTFAEAFQLGRNELPEETVTMALWEPEKSYLFPDVDYLMLLDQVEKPFFVPYDSLPEILDDGWVFIDERQMLVEAIPKEEWGAVVERAASFAETPLAG
jgi:hypothetical protein